MTALNNFNEQTREYYQQAADCARPRRHAAPGAIERKYPHIVELAVGKHGLDVGLGRWIMHFHNSRHIKPRHGHIVLKDRIWRRLRPSSNSLAGRFTIAKAR